MWTRAVCGLVALWLLGAGAAQAQEFPDGVFASDSDSCAKLETKTPAELGEELDFQVLSRKGLIAFQQICDFVSVVPHDSSSWVATAFCDESGYTYPDLFSVRLKGDGRLNVTRVTDLTQTSSAEDASMTGGVEEVAVADELAGEQAGEAEPNEPSPEEEAAESFSSFVKCPTVKP